jgi:hypothetical protein
MALNEPKTAVVGKMPVLGLSRGPFLANSCGDSKPASLN